MQPSSSIAQQSLAEQFLALDNLLNDLRGYWQLRPFACLDMPWQDDKALLKWLELLDESERECIEKDEDLRVASLSPFIPQAHQLRKLCLLPRSKLHAAPQAQPALSYHVPGRKWSQILDFSRSLAPEQRPIIEWCAGKGHLGRVLAFHHGTSVTSLELQNRLCRDGRQLSDRHNLPCTSIACDVMSEAAIRHLRPNQHAVALHACGKLHVRLLQTASSAGVERLSISPCCYQLIDSELYQPLSTMATKSSLQLSRHDLRLAVQETVTAGQRERRLRDREFHWRLAFDLLQRDIRNVDEYLNCPAVSKAVLNQDFTIFCLHMAQRKSLSLPANTHFTDYEQQGALRVFKVARMELVRHLFRRPLEMWLLLDRALYLQEQGYEVQLEEFCDYQLTPRNILIKAQKTASNHGP